MRRLAALCLVIALAAGCKTGSEGAPPAASADSGGPSGAPAGGASGGAEVTKSGVKFTNPSDSGSSGGSSALKWIAVPFENIVYLPWKLIGGAGKGLGDGVSAGFDKGRMPILGALFSPVNAVMGLLTGAGEGLGGSPGVIGPNDSFGYAMSQPTRHSTTIWWYE